MRWHARMRPRARWSPRASWLGCVCAVACVEPPANAVGGLPAPIIYGADQRLDVYEIDDVRVRRLAVERSVALMPAESLHESGDGSYRPDAPALGERLNLCSTERFWQQPSAAACSGVWVSDALVLTARHCADAVPCDEQRWVFHYAITEADAEIRLEEADIYRCRAVVARAAEGTAGHRLDYAFVALDRAPAFDTASLPLRTAELPTGAELMVIGYPDGLPAKVSGGAMVLNPRAAEGDYFTLDSDTFDKNSGSGVFDRALNLVGIFARGGFDYALSMQEGTECFEARRVEGPLDPDAGEQANYLRPALSDLCAGDWRSERLCDEGHTGGPDVAEQAGCSAIVGARRSGSRATRLMLLALLWLRRSRAGRGRPLSVER